MGIGSPVGGIGGTGPGGDGAEPALDQPLGLGDVEVTADAQDGVARRVVAGEEVGRVVDGGGLEVDEGAVAVVGVGEALEGDLRQLQPGERAVGPVEHVDPDLLLDHVDLVAEVLLGDRRGGHPVGLEEQRPLQRLGGQRLVVVRVVLVGRAVERAAGGLHQPGVLHLRHVAPSPGTSCARRGGRTRCGPRARCACRRRRRRSRPPPGRSGRGRARRAARCRA